MSASPAPRTDITAPAALAYAEYAPLMVQAERYRRRIRDYGADLATLDYDFPAGPEALSPKARAAAEYAEALRTLADLVEALPHIHRYNHFSAFYAESREQLAAITRAALAAGASVAKDVSEHNYDVALQIGPLKINALASRSSVCERVVTGTEVITKTIPAPGYVAEPVPTVEVTETVETVEWRCTPLLADAAEGADS